MRHVRDKNLAMGPRELVSLGNALRDMKMSIPDQLDVFLVGTGAKPAAKLVVYEEEKRLAFQGIFVEHGLHVLSMDNRLLMGRAPEVCDMLRFHIMRSDHFNTGLTLGYPEMAAAHFASKAKSCSSQADWVERTFIEAMIEGRKLPINIAYLNFVPPKVLAHNGTVELDFDTTELLRKYRHHVRRAFPVLDREVVLHRARELASAASRKQPGCSIDTEDPYFVIKRQ